ncbi:MAG TPA: hypothetical protein VEL28_08300 [Candidatus Binatia bacterium]|nr:hypothetical protein [Candidatus Binatia bacterium]
MTTTLRTTFFLAIAILPAAAHGGAQGPTPNELACRRQISETGRGYIEDLLDARIGCQNRAIKGRVDPGEDCTTGDGDRRMEKAIERANLVLGREMHDACDDVDLEVLGFPGSACANEKGGGFDVDDLEDCIAQEALPIVHSLLDFYYPPFQKFYGGERFICVRGTAVMAYRMFRGDLRGRDECALDVIHEVLPEDTQCRNDIEAWGPGTGDDEVDAHILRAYLELLNGVPEECKHFDLDEVGYQDVCPDDTDGEFSVIDLKQCLFDFNRAGVQAAMGLLFP